MRWDGMAMGCLCPDGKFERMSLPDGYSSDDLDSWVQNCESDETGCKLTRAAPSVWQDWHENGKLCAKNGGKKLYYATIVKTDEVCPDDLIPCIPDPANFKGRHNLMFCVDNYPWDCPIIDIHVETHDINAPWKPGYKKIKKFPTDQYDLYYSKTHTEQQYSNDGLPITQYTYKWMQDSVVGVWPCYDP